MKTFRKQTIPALLLLGTLGTALFSDTALAELDPDGTVQSVKWTTEEHPITGEERIELVITTRQHGDFANVLRFYVELADADGKKYAATGEGRFADNYGDRQLTRLSNFYLKDDGKLKITAYWVGFYFTDDSGEHLLSSKSRKLDDLTKWKASTIGCSKVAVENGSTELRPAD